MLTEKQQSGACKALEEFIYETCNDPVRVQLSHLDSLQVLLAGRGLELAPLVKAELADYLPANAMRTAEPAQTSPQPAPSAPAAPQAPAVALLLTPTERGLLRSAEMAAHDMRANPGFTFKTATVTGLTRIIRRVTGERG